MAGTPAYDLDTCESRNSGTDVRPTASPRVSACRRDGPGCWTRSVAAARGPASLQRGRLLVVRQLAGQEGVHRKGLVTRDGVWTAADRVLERGLRVQVGAGDLSA